jgi:hypothetical protein
MQIERCQHRVHRPLFPQPFTLHLYMSLAAPSTARHEALIEFAALGQADHLPLGCYVWPTDTFSAFN